MSTNTARLDALESSLDRMEKAVSRIALLLSPEAPAKKAPARKVTPKAPVLKKTQSRETLSRKDWNRTLTTLARMAGKTTVALREVTVPPWATDGPCVVSVYSMVLADWDRVQYARDNEGLTPEVVLARYL